jgi:chemotaxis protein MotA
VCVVQLHAIRSLLILLQRRSREQAVFANLALPGLVVLSLTLGAIFKPVFFDLFSFSFTLGGAVAVTCFSYSKKQLQALLAAVAALFAGSKDSLENHIAELSRVGALFRLQGLRGLENQERHLRDPYLRRGVELVVDLRSEETIRLDMEHRLACFVGEHETNRQILMTLGKLLPSFGLIGTLIGMVLLLANLSSQDQQTLPAALGLAVLTTLYGAVAANVLVAPVLARLQSVAVDQEIRMRLTKEWVFSLLRNDSAGKTDRMKGALLINGSDREILEPLAPAVMLLPRQSL